MAECSDAIGLANWSEGVIYIKIHLLASVGPSVEIICNLVAYGDTLFIWNSTHRLGYECIILCRVWKARAAPIPTLNSHLSTNISEMDIFSTKRFRIYVKTSTMLLQINGN